MAVERAKVIAALNTLLKGKSISKNLKEAYAKRWAEKIETDEDIDAYVQDREDDILDASKEADARATAAAAKAKADATQNPGGNPPKPETQEADVDPDMPKWAKSLLDQNKLFADKLAGFEAQKSADSITERFKKDDRLKDVPAIFLKGRIPSKEEDFEGSITDIITDYQQFTTDHKVEGFGSDAPAPGGPTVGAGKGKGNTVKAASKEDIAAVMNQL